MAQKGSILIASTQENDGALFSSIPEDGVAREPIFSFSENDRLKIGRSYYSVRIKFDPALRRGPLEFLIIETFTLAQFGSELKKKLNIPETETFILKNNGNLIPETQLFAEFKLKDPLKEWVEIDVLPNTANQNWLSYFLCQLI